MLAQNHSIDYLQNKIFLEWIRLQWEMGLECGFGVIFGVKSGELGKHLVVIVNSVGYHLSPSSLLSEVLSSWCGTFASTSRAQEVVAKGGQPHLSCVVHIERMEQGFFGGIGRLEKKLREIIL